MRLARCAGKSVWLKPVGAFVGSRAGSGDPPFKYRQWGQKSMMRCMVRRSESMLLEGTLLYQCEFKENMFAQRDNLQSSGVPLYFSCTPLSRLEIPSSLRPSFFSTSCFPELFVQIGRIPGSPGDPARPREFWWMPAKASRGSIRLSCAKLDPLKSDRWAPWISTTCLNKLTHINIGLPKTRKKKWPSRDLALGWKKEISQRPAFSGSWKIKGRLDVICFKICAFAAPRKLSV